MKGFRNLVWFIGIVEDNDDPLKLGRVRVRCFGFHSYDKLEAPTEDLPWATPINGTYNTAYKPPRLNSWVFGFFMDGDDAQHPMLLGTIPGMTTTLPTFTEGSYGTLDSSQNPCSLYQPDISRLARGENINETYVTARNAFADKEVKTANGSSWHTPPSSYNTQYPHNYVHETDSGHVIEYDDTPGSERITIHHTTGSSIEMDSVGNIKLNAEGDIFIVGSGNRATYIEGSDNITVDGNVNLYARNDMHIKVDGDLTQSVHGDYVLNVAGLYQTNVGQGIDMRGSRVAIESLSENIELHAKQNLRGYSMANTDLVGHGSLNMGSSGQVNIQSDTIFAADATEIYFNSGVSNGYTNAGTTKITSDPITLKTPIKIAKPTKIDSGILETDDEVSL